MNISYEEYDNPSLGNPSLEKQKYEIKKTFTKKRISYDDLLSSMNVQLNNGKIELININQQENYVPVNSYFQPQFNSFTNNPNYYNQQSQQQQQNIYQYQELTPEQQRYLKQQLFLKQYQERKRLTDIKSKKLNLYSDGSSPNLSKHINLSNPKTLGNLKKMQFK
jgi:hypothetical protein